MMLGVVYDAWGGGWLGWWMMLGVVYDASMMLGMVYDAWGAEVWPN